MTDTVIAVRGLTIALPQGADRRYAVESADLDIRRNEIVCIVGESGSGKSLTAHSVMGLLPRGVVATGGSISFNGTDLLRLPPEGMRRLRGRDIAMIFQDPMAALNPVVPVGCQIAEQIRAHRAMTEPQAMALAAELLGQTGLGAGVLQSFPFQLSGGQRQHVMIAMALSLSPSVLIADEPTSALDVTSQAQILKLLKTIQARQEMSILFITHDFGVVTDIADRVVVMRHGRIVESGAAADVLGNPADPYTRALIDAVPRLHGSPSAMPQGKPLLSVSGLSKGFRRSGILSAVKTIAVDAVALDISRGETLGIVGESGSGKSTLARCIIRLLDPDAGEILFDGVDIARMPPRALRPRRRRIQMVFQDPLSSLNPRQTVGNIITAGPRAYGEDAAESFARAAEMLRLVGLDPAAMRRLPHEFSGGQRQRIGLARALMLKPEILIADEPVSALDVTVQAQVLKLLDDVRRQMNLAMLFITHDMRVAAQICHRVMVMRHGKVVETGLAAQVFTRPRSDYTKELLAAIPGRTRLGFSN